jgi:hypothetical protein
MLNLRPRIEVAYHLVTLSEVSVSEQSRRAKRRHRPCHPERRLLMQVVRLLVRVPLGAFVATFLIAACFPDCAPAAADADSESTVWLCRPGLPNNPCASPSAATVVANGKVIGVTTASTQTASRFDCFYVYPTVSPQVTANTDLQVQNEERGIATDQASRFSQACNVWAPVYRQITVPTQDQHRYDTPAYGDIAYASVLSAWQEYRARYNNGLPVIFIGHSQGTQMIARLLRQEIEPHAELRRQVLLAILVGGNIAVANTPHGRGSFASIPPCRSTGQTGCVIAYSLFSTAPPADSRFGIPGQAIRAQRRRHSVH